MVERNPERFACRLRVRAGLGVRVGLNIADGVAAWAGAAQDLDSWSVGATRVDHVQLQ
jgi:hypothetical protein